jgi:hypothetical protein
MEKKVAEAAEAALQEMVPAAMLDSLYLSGAKAGWNAAQSDNPHERYAQLFKSREGYVADIKSARANLAGLTPAPNCGPVVGLDIEKIKALMDNGDFGAARVVALSTSSVRDRRLEIMLRKVLASINHPLPASDDEWRRGMRSLADEIRAAIGTTCNDPGSDCVAMAQQLETSGGSHV